MGTCWWLLAILAIACGSENPDLDGLLINLRSQLDSATADLLPRFVPDTEAPWHSRAAQLLDDHPRDELGVTSLAQDDDFKFGAGVDRWMSVSVGSTTYMVGYRSDGFNVVTARLISPDVGAGQATAFSENKFDTAGKPLAADFFKYWNPETKVSEAILILTLDTPGDLIWYRIGDGKIDKIQSWPMHKLVTYIKVFVVHDQYKLLIVTPCDDPRICHSIANIYDFTHFPQDAKLSHSLKLEGNSTSVQVGTVGDEVYLALALPTPGVVKLFKYRRPLASEETSGNSTYGWFETWKDLSSPGVSNILFFDVSYKLYLAIGGAQPALLRFVSPTRLEGCSKAIQSLGTVSAWMVVPVSTYREEVILLAQLENTYGSSRSVVIMTWGGVGVFKLLPNPPCLREKQSVNGGASCLISGSNKLGLGGAIVLSSQGTTVSLVIPNGAEPSALFVVRTQMYPLSNPLVYELSMLKEMRAKLEAEINLQAYQIAEIESMLSNTLQLNGPNIVSNTWIVQEIYTPEHEDVQNASTIDFAGQQDVNSFDPAVEISALETLMSELYTTMKSMNETLSDAAVPVSGEVHLSGALTMLGGVEISSTTILDSVSLNKINGESVPHLLKNAVRIDRMEKIGGTKTLINTDIDHIQFGTVNDVPGDELVFNIPGKNVVINGNLVVAHALRVEGDVELPNMGTVNGIDLSEKVFQPGKTFKGQVLLDQVAVEGDLTVDVVNEVAMHPYNLRSIVLGIGDPSAENDTKYDSVQIGGQLIVERINGYLWDDLMQRIVWKNSSDHIEGETIVDGVFHSEPGMEVWKLNDVAFPDDYVLKKGGTQHISGTKTVLGDVYANSADVSGTVDGVPVRSLVTLTSEQVLQGELKLNEADVSGDIKVDLGINGISLARIQNQSPNLGQGVVSSNVRFSNLEVVGKVSVSGNLDGHNFNEYLSDIVLTPEVAAGTVVISGKKELQSGLSVGGSGLNILTGRLNGGLVKEYISTDTPQTLLGDKTIEKVTFGNLFLTGTWDGVNVLDLNADTMRLNGNQESSANLTFVESGKLWASRLVISEYLNTDVTTTALKMNDQLCDANHPSKECVIDGPVHIDNLRVAGNIIIGGQVCEWDLADFEARRLSRARPQTIIGDLQIHDAHITSHLTVSSLNKISVESWTKIYQAQVPHDKSYNLNEMLAVGGFAIDELNIVGNIHTRSVNGFSFADIAKNAIKLGKNRITTNLIFEDFLDVGMLTVFQSVNGINISLLYDDAVFKKSSHPTKISGLKMFDAGMIVDGNIDTQFINGLAPSTIITKSSEHHLQGPLHITGNVQAENLNVIGQINNIPIDAFLKRYKYLGDGRHELQGNVHFGGEVVVDDLFVMGYINGQEMNKFFDSVVLKTETSRITGNKVFINKVIFNTVEVDGTVNDMGLKAFAEDLVLHNGDEPVTIQGRLVFLRTLTVHGGVSLSRNLEATDLYGCPIQEWIDNAVYLDQPLHVYGYKKLFNISSTSDLDVRVLNALDLQKVITLHSEQEIPGKLSLQVASIHHDVEVGSLVNGIKLQSEVENTLLTYGDQTVVGQKVFLSGLTTKGNLVTSGLVSGRDLKNVITLNNPQVIKGALRFQNMIVEGNMRLSGDVSHVDVKKWKERALLRQSPDLQTVTGKWTIQQNEGVRFLSEVLGHGLLGGKDVESLFKSASLSRQLTLDVQERVKDDWEKMCYDTNALLEKARAQPFLFQQLEVVQALPSLEQISSMHAFELSNEQFLIVSYAHNCLGALYHWNGDSTAWELQSNAMDHVGAVQRWATLKTVDGTYLATSSDNNSCNYVGGNIWKVGQGAELQNVRSIDPWSDLQVDEERGRIYTLGEKGVSAWSVAGGRAERLHDWSLDTTDGAQFVPRSIGLGLSVSDGKSLSLLNDTNSARPTISRSANPHLPARSLGNVASMKVAGGRKLVAVVPEESNMLVVYEDALSGHILGRVWAHGAHSLSVLELTAPGRAGQTLLAFIEDDRRLRVVEYKGVQGLVDVAVARLAVAVKEMVPVRLRARGLVNKRHFLLLRSDHQVLLVEVEMAGDPLDQPELKCEL